MRWASADVTVDRSSFLALVMGRLREQGGDVGDRFGTNPLPQKLPIAPIFIADTVWLAVFARKGLEIAPGLRRMGRCEGRRAGEVLELRASYGRMLAPLQGKALTPL